MVDFKDQLKGLAQLLNMYVTIILIKMLKRNPKQIINDDITLPFLLLYIFMLLTKCKFCKVLSSLIKNIHDIQYVCIAKVKDIDYSQFELDFYAQLCIRTI